MARGWKTNINPSAKAILSGAAARGLALAGEHILQVSNTKVPIEEATLERSGVVSTGPENFTATVSYDTPYAARQHEEMNYRHDNGRSAKFLENAFNSETDAVRTIIARTISGEL
ncbi:hypothetical protein ACFFON_15460 [Arthrobacter citreus]|uniref:hypothetical protein n=1 Tax=Arthrobacter TaxID=1663 RepID=UPI001264E1BC|nr:hypothetical protein [Arthrobacter gandavensis]